MSVASPNSVKFRPLAALKRRLVTPGRRPMRVRAGLYRGMVLVLDPAHETQFRLGLYEQETFACIRRALRHASWMVDVGAGSGELAIFSLRQPGCRKVHAFEPQAQSLKIFQSNLALNDLSTDSRLAIHPLCAGTGPAPDFLALDRLGLPLAAPGFLKIDVDGFELDVLDSAAILLAQGQADVLVEVHSAALEAACIARLKGFGYHVEIIANAWWRRLVPERRPIAHNRWIFASRPMNQS